MAPRKASPRVVATPYRAKLTPYYEISTRVQVWRTLGDVLIHNALHRGGVERATAIVHDVIEADERALDKPP